MREVFCIVGLPAMGKTTLRRAILQRRFGLRAFSSDHTARRVMETTRTAPPFSVQEANRWRALDRHVDVYQLKVWAYLEQLAPLGQGPLGCDGWGFYDPAERRALEDALGLLGESHVHYLHLVRPLADYNALRRARGLAPVERVQLDAELGRHDLDFLESRISCDDDLMRFVEGRLPAHA